MTDFNRVFEILTEMRWAADIRVNDDLRPMIGVIESECRHASTFYVRDEDYLKAVLEGAYRISTVVEGTVTDIDIDAEIKPCDGSIDRSAWVMAWIRVPNGVIREVLTDGDK